jgi:hypothetical protein
MRGGRDDLRRCFCKSLLTPPLSAPLDQHHVAQVQVSIIFTERLVSTLYVAVLIYMSFRTSILVLSDPSFHPPASSKKTEVVVVQIPLRVPSY